MEWTQHVCDEVRCRRPVCVGWRLPVDDFVPRCDPNIIPRLATMAPKMAACFSRFLLLQLLLLCFYYHYLLRSVNNDMK